MIAITPHAEGSSLAVLVHPGSRRVGVLGERAGALRIGVAAPPEKGKANAAVQAFLAEILGCRASQIRLLAGETSRHKRFLIAGQSAEELQRRLALVVADPAPAGSDV